MKQKRILIRWQRYQLLSMVFLMFRIVGCRSAGYEENQPIGAEQIVAEGSIKYHSNPLLADSIRKQHNDRSGKRIGAPGNRRCFYVISRLLLSTLIFFFDIPQMHIYGIFGRFHALNELLWVW